MLAIVSNNGLCPFRLKSLLEPHMFSKGRLLCKKSEYLWET